MTQIPRLLGARWRQETAQRPTLPFYFVPSDGLTSPRSGQPITFTRNTYGIGLDASGRPYLAMPGEPRLWSYDLDSDGVFETAALRLDIADPNETNYLGYSQDLTQAAVWVPTGTGSVGAAVPFGAVAMHKVVDSDGAAAYLLRQTLGASTLYSVGNAMALSAFIAVGDTDPASAKQLRVIETGTLTSRGGASWVYASGVPTFTAVGGGTLLTGANGVRLGKLADGRQVYWFAVALSASLVNTNAHYCEITVAMTGAQTGNTYIGGIQIERMPGASSQTPSPYHPNYAASGAAIRGAEQWWAPWLAKPQTLTAYLKFVSAPMPTGSSYLRIGDYTDADTSFNLSAGVNQFTGIVKSGGATLVSYNSGISPGAINVAGEVRMVVKEGPSGVLRIGYRTLGGVETVASSSAITALFPNKFSSTDNNCRVNIGTGAGVGLLGLGIAWGEQTMDYMASFF